MMILIRMIKQQFRILTRIIIMVIIITMMMIMPVGWKCISWVWSGEVTKLLSPPSLEGEPSLPLPQIPITMMMIQIYYI